MKIQYFYARPHARWQLDPITCKPIERDGRLVAELDADGNAVVACYTPAIGFGNYSEPLASAPAMPWIKFKRARDRDAFIAAHDAKRKAAMLTDSTP